MSNEDWYRLTSWSKKDQNKFYERLNRCRGVYYKAQYARIQAGYLQSIGTKKMLKNSIELLNRMISEWPDKAELAQAYLQRAECFEKLKEIKLAIEAYRKSFESQRNYANSKTMAYLQFSTFVIENDLFDLFNEANEILDEFTDDLLFPIDKFKYCASKAIFYFRIGDIKKSKDFATKAIEAAGKTESGFTYHKKTGLVEKISPKIAEYLNNILELN